MRISDWSSDVCSSDLPADALAGRDVEGDVVHRMPLTLRRGEARVEVADIEDGGHVSKPLLPVFRIERVAQAVADEVEGEQRRRQEDRREDQHPGRELHHLGALGDQHAPRGQRLRSEEHTSELQSLMRISYAVFYLKKKIYTITN